MQALQTCLIQVTIVKSESRGSRYPRTCWSGSVLQFVRTYNRMKTLISPPRPSRSPPTPRRPRNCLCRRSWPSFSAGTPRSVYVGASTRCQRLSRYFLFLFGLYCAYCGRVCSIQCLKSGSDVGARKTRKNAARYKHDFLLR